MDLLRWLGWIRSSAGRAVASFQLRYSRDVRNVVTVLVARGDFSFLAPQLACACCFAGNVLSFLRLFCVPLPSLPGGTSQPFLFSYLLTHTALCHIHTSVWLLLSLPRSLATLLSQPCRFSLHLFLHSAFALPLPNPVTSGGISC